MELPQILCEVAIGTSHLVIDQTKVKTAKEIKLVNYLGNALVTYKENMFSYIVSYIATYTVH